MYNPSFFALLVLHSTPLAPPFASTYKNMICDLFKQGARQRLSIVIVMSEVRERTIGQERGDVYKLRPIVPSERVPRGADSESSACVAPRPPSEWRRVRVRVRAYSKMHKRVYL